jgi:predicted nucleic acid-binding protein
MKARGERPSPRPVLIDSPIWQSYFQKEERIFQEVNTLMDAGRICCLDLVVAELLATAKTEQEIKVLGDFTRVFPILWEPPRAWLEAAHLVFQLRQRKKALSLRDGYLAVMAQSHQVLLYSTNKLLRKAQRSLELKLEFYPDRRNSD